MKIQKHAVFILGFAVAMGFAGGCKGKKADSVIEGTSTVITELSKDAVLEAAKNKAAALAILVENMDVTYDESNAKWIKSMGEMPALAGKNYQAVLFFPKNVPAGTLASGIWFIVDRNTGEILYFVEEAS